MLYPSLTCLGSEDSSDILYFFRRRRRGPLLFACEFFVSYCLILVPDRRCQIIERRLLGLEYLLRSPLVGPSRICSLSGPMFLIL